MRRGFLVLPMPLHDLVHQIGMRAAFLDLDD
jgi:hypothetical protein